MGQMTEAFARKLISEYYDEPSTCQGVTVWEIVQLAQGYVANIEAEAELTRLRTELETERLRLAACGVVALADTQESAAKARGMLPQYRSASCDDVARRVDECIRLRTENDILKDSNASKADRLDRLGEQVVRLRAEVEALRAALRGLLDALPSAIKEAGK